MEMLKLKFNFMWTPYPFSDILIGFQQNSVSHPVGQTIFVFERTPFRTLMPRGLTTLKEEMAQINSHYVKELTPNDTCHFNGCKEKVRPGTRKCVFHRKKGICRMKDCRNQVYARSLCVRHGARKPCIHIGCDGFARYGGYCCKHGDKYNVKGCTHEGCSNKAHARQKCVRHGGGKKCKEEGCDSHARNSGLCFKHMEFECTPQRNAQISSGIPAPTIPGRPSMTDICMQLSKSYGLPTPMNLSFNSTTTKLPSIRLSFEYKPYFVINA